MICTCWQKCFIKQRRVLYLCRFCTFHMKLWGSNYYWNYCIKLPGLGKKIGNILTHIFFNFVELLYMFHFVFQIQPKFLKTLTERNLKYLLKTAQIQPFGKAVLPWQKEFMSTCLFFRNSHHWAMLWVSNVVISYQTRKQRALMHNCALHHNKYRESS